MVRGSVGDNRCTRPPDRESRSSTQFPARSGGVLERTDLLPGWMVGESDHYLPQQTDVNTLLPTHNHRQHGEAVQFWTLGTYEWGDSPLPVPTSPSLSRWRYRRSVFVACWSSAWNLRRRQLLWLDTRALGGLFWKGKRSLEYLHILWHEYEGGHICDRHRIAITATWSRFLGFKISKDGGNGRVWTRMPMVSILTSWDLILKRWLLVLLVTKENNNSWISMFFTAGHYGFIANLVSGLCCDSSPLPLIPRSGSVFWTDRGVPHE